MKRILFIGGTGVISAASSALAIEKGFDLYHLNRGESARLRPVEGVKTLIGDVRDRKGFEKLISKQTFDVVVNWLAYEKEHVETDIHFFKDRIGQYLFISSASAYQTPPAVLPVTENCPLENPFWEYSRKKIECEYRLMAAYREEAFPVSIVRPSHTYDKTKIPLPGGYTTLHRMRKGKKVIVPGDGSSIWTLTHARDFAQGFVSLLGEEASIGEAFHITSDEWLTWRQIFLHMAKAQGVEARLLPVPSEIIARYDQELGDSLLGDKAHSMLFDNSKIKKINPAFRAEIPFSQGAREIVEWYSRHPEWQVVDHARDRLFDQLVERMSF